MKANTRLCVCEIMDSLNENQYNVSRHLKSLKNAGFLKEEKEGRWVYYSLIDLKNRFQELILEAVSSLPEELFSKESERLKKRLTLRENGKCVEGMNSEECYKI
jgi:ArsR family transcriptional regulator